MVWLHNRLRLIHIHLKYLLLSLLQKQIKLGLVFWLSTIYKIESRPHLVN